jgi:hypothetical protein
MMIPTDALSGTESSALFLAHSRRSAAVQAAGIGKGINREHPTGGEIHEEAAGDRAEKQSTGPEPDLNDLIGTTVPVPV